MNSVAEIQIFRKNLISNIRQIREKLPAGNKIAAVVKANAYGHGMKEIVSIAEKYIDYFQVDDFAELKEIRQYTKKPVLVFGFVSVADLNECVRLNAILGIYDLEVARKLNAAAKKRNKIIPVHVKVDAFLGRQGILRRDAQKFFAELSRCKNLSVEAVYSHFSNIEDVSNLSQAKLQHQELLAVKKIATKAGFKNIFHHISATSGFLTDQKNNWGGKIVRLGIGLYGLWPSESLRRRFGGSKKSGADKSERIILKPVMRWVTRIAQIKKIPKNFPVGYGCTFITKTPTTVAVLPQGYSDGYDRGFSNNSEVLVLDRRCPIIGRVAMNMIVADVTGLAKGHPTKSFLDKISKAEVVLLGRQGKEEISAEELAARIGTINYEIVTRVWPNLKRVII
ncbi:MAG TPA: alanine racemase [Candidatus Paceibacterota bacterium]|nr:alanine racemase [Candidatus Paceibacterota bacterium]HRZ34672.1 alanine racemase [Candidatus Paceibacterota bacterium]